MTEEKRQLKKLDPKIENEQLVFLRQWVTDQVDRQDVPRLSDVLDYAYRIMKFNQLKKGKIAQMLRLHPAYLMNSSQVRKRLGKHRPIIVRNIGVLHGDIGFFAVNSEYEMPLKKRSGFVVCKDVCTGFVAVEVLDGNRTSKSMIKAMRGIISTFKKQYPDVNIQSLSFDQERSVMSHDFQAFLKEENIKFHPFANTSSKAKLAENAIRQIRTTIRRLRKKGELRWWILIHPAVRILNNRPIQIKGKFLKLPANELEEKNHVYYSPNDVNSSNLGHFLAQKEKTASPYYFAQFNIAPQTVEFKFKVGDFVKPKLIVISSQVVGEKRSEINLSSDTFVIEKLLPFISVLNTVEKAYECRNIATASSETFAEDEIALTVDPFQTGF